MQALPHQPSLIFKVFRSHLNKMKTLYPQPPDCMWNASYSVSAESPPTRGVNLNLKGSEFLLCEWHRDHTLKLASPVSDELKSTPITAMHNPHFWMKWVAHHIPGLAVHTLLPLRTDLSLCCLTYSTQSRSYSDLSFSSICRFHENLSTWWEGRPLGGKGEWVAVADISDHSDAQILVTISHTVSPFSVLPGCFKHRCEWSSERAQVDASTLCVDSHELSE